MRLFAALLFIGLVPLAQAQMYKCKDDRGRWVFSDKPLPGCAGAPQAPAAKPAPPPAAMKAPAAKPAPSLPADARALNPRRGLPGLTKSTGPASGPLRAPPPQKAATSAQENSQYVAQCKASREELQWLLGPRGERVENREARVAQVRQALGKCR